MPSSQLLKTKFPEIQRSLDAISISSAARSAWQAIKAPNKPDISEVAQWGKEKLAGYAALVSATAHSYSDACIKKS